ncbi:YrhK family protein [Nocardioides bruguierae]|uniref:YrhK family protein n=1 Tax=Nocardioides bruguierae TaxID=2945102 RepID=A0A9X2DB87_9ACTN|nr:YrhK family protein [Nocardioides bruguierae]MCL8023885.1 YrhK family protein [Nocardioides bruguierae]MCM0622785.1 YrhK family protein [Nocardioides bruguierae]
MPDLDLDLPGTDRELVLRHRYETLSTINDLLIAVWFIIGSVLFLREATTLAGTWLFIVGSVQLAVRPALRLSRRVHLTRHRARHGGAAADHASADDF